MAATSRSAPSPASNHAATACAETKCIAVPVKRDEETLGGILQRLDHAIEEAQTNACMIDGINVKQ